MVAYKKIINRQAQKVVAVAYRNWSFTRGSNCKALTGHKFWCFGLVVAYGRCMVAYEKWSHMVVRLYSGLMQIKIDGRTPFSWAQTAHEIS